MDLYNRAFTGQAITYHTNRNVPLNGQPRADTMGSFDIVKEGQHLSVETGRVRPEGMSNNIQMVMSIVGSTNRGLH